MKRVDIICKNIIDNNGRILPISPLHMFNYFDNDKPDFRPSIMKMCFKMIDHCEEILVYKYGELAPGQIDEINYAKENNKNIKIIEIRGGNIDVKN